MTQDDNSIGVVQSNVRSQHTRHLRRCGLARVERLGDCYRFSFLLSIPLIHSKCVRFRLLSSTLVRNKCLLPGTTYCCYVWLRTHICLSKRRTWEGGKQHCCHRERLHTWPFDYPKRNSTGDFALQRVRSPSRGRGIFGGYDFSPSRTGCFFCVLWRPR